METSGRSCRFLRVGLYRNMRMTMADFVRMSLVTCSVVAPLLGEYLSDDNRSDCRVTRELPSRAAHAFGSGVAVLLVPAFGVGF